MSAWAITIVVVSIPLVRAMLRTPRRLLLTTALVAIAAMNLITAFAPGFELALAGRMLTATTPLLVIPASSPRTTGHRM